MQKALPEAQRRAFGMRYGEAFSYLVSAALSQDGKSSECYYAAFALISDSANLLSVRSPS